MIIAGDEYISLLMGAPAIVDEDLNRIDVEIVEQHGTGIRCLCIPKSSLERYKNLVMQKLEPGYWNDIVGRTEILFVFKFVDGTVQELTYSPETASEIAQICSILNGDPIEKTSDIPRYLASAGFYRDTLVKWHGVTL